MSNTLDAENLYRNSNSPEIGVYVKDIYNEIKQKITLAHRNGRSSIEYDPPSLFNVIGYSKADSQLIIYARVVEKIEEHGIRIALHKKSDGGLKMVISWPSVLDPSEKKRLQDILRRHMVN